MGTAFRPEYKHGRWTRYHYDLLNDRQKAIFKQIKIALNEEKDSVFVAGASKADLPFKIFTGVLNDFPLMYWVSPNLRYVIQSDGLKFMFTFNEHYANRKKYDGMLETISRDLFDRYVKDMTSEYEVELFVHDYLASKVVYDKSDDSTAHCLLGPLLKGRGVCNGIADAASYLMNAFGLKVTSINGHDPSAPVGHCWNVIKLGDHYYHLDVTNDLFREGVPCHAFMNMDDEMASNTHKYKCQQVCGSLEFNFYNLNGCYFRELRDADQYLVTRLKKGSRHVELYTDRPSEPQHFFDVMRKAGICGELHILAMDDHRFIIYL